jgi:hypothetical protein
MSIIIKRNTSSNSSSNSSISASERTALGFMATLPMKIIPKQTFAPHLPIQYRDGDGVELIGKPDALCIQHLTKTHIENKNGVLNHHLTKESCHRALQQEFDRTMHDGREKSYSALTAHFRVANMAFLLENSWNQSVWKVLALQSLHGWDKYLVCFKRNPSAKDAERYIKAGLVFCVEATLAQMLHVIELAAHGVYITITLEAPRSGYAMTVNASPNPAHEGLTPEQFAAANRAAYEAVVQDARPKPFVPGVICLSAKDLT